jgi:putative transposase
LGENRLVGLRMPPYRRRKPLRKGVDLTWKCDYMITILTKNKVHLFGQIENGEMKLNAYGQLAYHFWERTEIVYPYAKLFEFVIMPEHIHGIIRILPTTMKVKSISTMIKSFKREVTKEIHLMDPTTPKLIWQESFWARGFRNENQLKAYEVYIRNNPRKAWEKEMAEKKIVLK